MKSIIILLVTLCISPILFGQEVSDTLTQYSKDQVQANYIMQIGASNSYGLNLEYNRELHLGKKGGYKLYAGAFNEFFVSIEEDIEGMSGNTTSNQLGLTLTNQFNFFKKKKVYLANTLYAGWGRRRTKTTYKNDVYNINRDYQVSNNYLAFGTYMKAGYQINPKLGVHLIGKIDFSRLIDEYEPKLLERPGFMYGAGLTYKL